MKKVSLNKLDTKNTTHVIESTQHVPKENDELDYVDNLNSQIFPNDSIISIDSIEVKIATETLSEKKESKPKTVVLGMGKTLRLLALDHYGHREFWIYIYLENRDKINNPNNVPVGIELVIPSKQKYDINANNPNSIKKAIEKGNEELSRL